MHCISCLTNSRQVFAAVANSAWDKWEAASLTAAAWRQWGCAELLWIVGDWVSTPQTIPVDIDQLAPMPAPSHFPSPQQAPPQPFPALKLFPLNDSFIPKHIHLNQRVKIGRQTNAKTVPGERNGYFDSKVLSRTHAEVWEENGKVREPPTGGQVETAQWSYRSISKTLKVPMALSSMENDFLPKAWTQSPLSSNLTTSL